MRMGHWILREGTYKASSQEESPNVPRLMEDKNAVQEQPAVADSQEEADALRTPQLNVPGGVLSVILHQINNRMFHVHVCRSQSLNTFLRAVAGRQDITDNPGTREGQAGQTTSEPTEEGEHLIRICL